MGGQKRRDRVASLHKENIMLAAEHLFLDKGFEPTTIQEISKLSGYSRRTIYAYFESKEDILYHITLRGLLDLQKEIINVVETPVEFLEKYNLICQAMEKYHTDSVQSFNELGDLYQKENSRNPNPVVISEILDTVGMIYSVLAEFIESGKAEGRIFSDIETMATVHVLWFSISSLLDMVQSKGGLFIAGLEMELDVFLQYSFRQIINSILIERIPWKAGE